jgi:chemotaxis methyl-accepting protein methylase
MLHKLNKATVVPASQRTMHVKIEAFDVDSGIVEQASEGIVDAFLILTPNRV